MALYCQVRESDGAGGRPPAGWPLDITEPADFPAAPAVAAGFTAVMTPAQIAARRTSLQSSFSTWAAAAKAQRDADEAAARKAMVVELGDKDVLQPLFRVLFAHENRIRALEGKAAVTLAQFKTALRNLMD